MVELEVHKAGVVCALVVCDDFLVEAGTLVAYVQEGKAARPKDIFAPGGWDRVTVRPIEEKEQT